MKNLTKIVSILLLHASICIANPLLNKTPVHSLINPNHKRGLVNSVDFHPNKNQCCVTYTQNNKVILYNIDNKGIHLSQILQNPHSKLNSPQHAIFSKDGRHLIVANWTNQTFNVYSSDNHGCFLESPHTVTSYANGFKNFHPHGIALSPEGDFLAVAFGASKLYPRGIALFKVMDLDDTQPSFTPYTLLQSPEIHEGIPKGIIFSPDGSHLLVTFSETNSISLYEINKEIDTINVIPKQVIKGFNTKISRPEDIKFTANNEFIAVSNSTSDCITFYPFNSTKNRFTSQTPSFTLKNPESDLSFPHGLAFSYDGKYFGVTQFGNVIFNKNGDLSSWKGPRKDSISIYEFN
ncbi:MAG: beta-propeller fold lactonase family protein [Chlamydiota bacterium]|nr:beta-propeller fold lactonase family protein [Chlamydiota bacterium]